VRRARPRAEAYSRGVLASTPTGSQRIREAFAVASSRPVVTLALKAAVGIGTLLNLINQGDALFGAGPVVPLKLLVTYLVPYCTATYSATSISLRMRR
jgi:NAD kinase